MERVRDAGLPSGEGLAYRILLALIRDGPVSGRRLLSLLALGALLLGCGGPPPDRDEVGGPLPAPTVAARPSATAGSPGCPAYGAGWSPIADRALRPAPDLAEPAPRQWFADPVFGTCLVRVTDRAHDLLSDDGSTGLTNEYSRVQSFNADGSLLLARGTEATWYLYDAQTLLPLAQLPLAVEPRWDAADPGRIYYTDGVRLVAAELQIEAGAVTVAGEQLHDFAADLGGRELAAVWTRYEGSPSRDRRYWALMAEDENWLPVAFLVYDRATDRVTVRDMRAVPGVEEDVDHVTMSPLGTYFLASFDLACQPGSLGDDAHPCGLMVYDRALGQGRGLLRIIGHYDVALDAQGREVIVYQDIDADQIAMLDLATGAVTPLWDIDFSHTSIGLHFSGLAYDRPGWAVVSTYDDDPRSYTWLDDQVLVVELKAGGRVARLAHTRSLRDEGKELDYWAEPHASTNSDLTRILFSTNWGRSGTGQVEVYLIELPPDWLDRLASAPARRGALVSAPLGP